MPLTLHASLSLIIFFACYLGVVLFHDKKILFSFITVFLLISLGIVKLGEVPQIIDWNVIFIIIGTSLLVCPFVEAKIPQCIADGIVNHLHRADLILISICLFAGFISAFLENVSTVLIVAPVALELTRRMDISPVDTMIAVAVSSNLQGAATLIGDPPSMILASYTRMNFNDFIIFKGKPGLFFAVQIGAIFSTLVLWIVFRNCKKKINLHEEVEVISWVPGYLLGAMIITLIIVSSLNLQVPCLLGIVCLTFGILGIITTSLGKMTMSLKKYSTAIDWETIFFLSFIFIIIYALTKNNWMEFIARKLAIISRGNILLAYILIIIVSLLVSAFVDNIPYLVAAIPVAHSLSGAMNRTSYLLLFGLLIGCTLGGNITPIGASANVTAVGILKRNGYRVTFIDFLKVGLPFTLSAVLSASIFLWFVWK
ncbi:MAG: SLC13 family permease [bacterium]